MNNNLDSLDNLILQIQFVSRVGPLLERFSLHNTNPLSASCRCNICGDSQKSKTKRRGSFYQRDYTLFYNCFNCGASYRFDTYLKLYFPSLFSEYLYEKKFGSVNKQDLPEENKQEVNDSINPMNGLDLAKYDNQCLKYIKSRKIPEEKWDRIYYTSEFYRYVNTILPNKFSENRLLTDHKRIVFPFRDVMKTCFGLNSRAIDDEYMRYISVMFDKSFHKIYGIEYIDFNKPIYCTEGPIDSLFLDNAISFGGSDGNLDVSYIVVLDNERHNQDIVSKYHKYIDRGHPIFVWPSKIKSKDINDLVLNEGYSPSVIQNIIENNIYSGLKAKIQLQKWQKQI